MIDEINKWLTIPTFLAVVVIALVLVGGNNQSAFGGTTNYDSLELSENLTVDGTSTLTGATSLNGAATLNAGQIRSYTVASSSVTTGTLAESDILNYDTLLYTPGGAAATKILTLPATSTITSMVPTAGDIQETCIYNATSTAASTITLAAGAGMDLERVATSTTSGAVSVLVIPANGYACLKFVRQTDTDIGALMTSYINSD